MAQLKDLIVTGSARTLGKCYASEFIGQFSGNALTATKLATARNISLSGSVNGSTVFDGSGDINITTTVNSGTTAPSSLANGQVYFVYEN